jgi:SNF2 family DNA or RNA helicase
MILTFSLGDIKQNERVRLQTAINTPNRSPRIILLLTRECGGVALNFHGAHHVIQLEPCYNPQKEEQSFGRIWRRSKQEDCHHWHLISANNFSVDQIIKRYSFLFVYCLILILICL